MESGEREVTYTEGENVRVLRGMVSGLEDEAASFVTVTRRDGVVQINKKNIVKVEAQNDGGRDG